MIDPSIPRVYPVYPQQGDPVSASRLRYDMARRVARARAPENLARETERL
jgi:hypothetical protein